MACATITGLIPTTDRSPRRRRPVATDRPAGRAAAHAVAGVWREWHGVRLPLGRTAALPCWCGVGPAKMARRLSGASAGMVTNGNGAAPRMPVCLCDGLGELLRRPDAEVLIVEGEKACKAGYIRWPDHGNGLPSGWQQSSAGHRLDAPVWPQRGHPGRRGRRRQDIRRQGGGAMPEGGRNCTEEDHPAGRCTNRWAVCGPVPEAWQQRS